MLSNKQLIVIVGPTAVGKTALGVQIAKYLNTDVVSADSRQFYKEMSIGTAKPTPFEMQGVKHHFVDSLSVSQKYNAGDFERDGLSLLNSLFETKDYVVMVGGSGMYVKALCDGLDDMPEYDDTLRNQLKTEAQMDYPGFLGRLKVLDPVYYDKVDHANVQRVIRAMEVCVATGLPFSDLRKSEKKHRTFNTVKIGLDMDRTKLYQLIDQRMEHMLTVGLFDEAKSLYAYKHEYALQTIGYTEIYGYIDGAYDWSECVRLLKRNSRRYAKRQLTWFKSDPLVRWYDVGKANIWEEIKKGL